MSMLPGKNHLPEISLVIRDDQRTHPPVRLEPGESATIGRSPDNDIVLQDDICSRRHCEIFSTPQGWSVRDLGSRNGTTVNGTPVGDNWELEDGQVVIAGHSEIRVRIRSANLPSALRDTDTAIDSSPPEILHRTRESRFRSEQSGDSVGRKLSWLYRLGLEMGTAPDVSSLCDLTLSNLHKRVTADIGGILLLPEPTKGNPSPDELTLIAHTAGTDSDYRPLSAAVSRIVLSGREGVLTADVDQDSELSQSDSLGQFHVNSVLCAPIRFEDDLFGVIHFYSSQRTASLTADDVDLVVAVGDQLAVVLNNISQRESLSLQADRYRNENLHLRQRLDLDAQLIGQSDPMRRLRDTIMRIAPTDATALIRGESGVGKEVVARAIHENSARKGRPFITMNCAALSETLLESELFGHEKGSFTGATGRKPGKFEQAHEGTLFLDEVGEMGMAIQAKFLRVLEGHPFERVGGNQRVDVNVRVVAATNRDLEDAVAAGEFRKDLYFRLHVMEIHVVSLRERKDDIALLARHFLERSAQKTGRPVQRFSPSALQLLLQYHWPGNVRELQNAVERAVILCGGAEIEVDDIKLSGLQTEAAAHDTAMNISGDTYRSISLEQLEREHILRTLQETSWNKSQASQILGIERSTLDRKLKRYNVQRP